MYHTVLQEVCQIIADHLGVPLADVRPQANLAKELMIDSLDLVEFTMLFQRRFGCAWNGSVLDFPLRSVEDLARLLSSMEPRSESEEFFQHTSTQVA